jgi:hypothetical protein
MFILKDLWSNQMSRHWKERREKEWDRENLKGWKETRHLKKSDETNIKIYYIHNRF